VDEAAIEQDLRALRAAVEHLSSRVALLERAPSREGRGAAAAGGLASSAASPAGEPSDDTPLIASGAVAVVFRRLAIVSFALLGALVLRVLTQQGMISSLVGVPIGLVYCAVLVFAPTLAARRRVVGSRAVLQYSGVVLAPLIVLESVGQGSLLGMTSASLIIIGVGSAGVLAALLASDRGLACTSLLVGLCATAALGLAPEAAFCRAAAVVTSVAATLWLSRRAAMAFLLPVLAPLAAVLLGLALFAAARRQGMPPEAPLVVLAAIGVTWLLAVVRVVANGAPLSLIEAALLPSVTAWAYVLLCFVAPAAGLPLGLGLVLVALAASGVLVARRHESSLIASLVVSAAVVGVLFLPPYAWGGAALALVALATAWAGLRLPSTGLGLWSLFVAAAAALGGLVGGELVGQAAPTLDAAAFGAALAALLWLHARVLGGPGLAGRGDRWWRLFVPSSLGSGFVVAFAALHMAGRALASDDGVVQLADLVFLAVLSLTGVVVGRRRDINSLFFLGLAGMGVLTLFGVRALFTLTGGLLLAAVVTVGLAYVVTSISWSRRTAAPQD